MRDEEYDDEETAKRARDAIRRSFETPYKPQKVMVGKVGRSAARKRGLSKKVKKPK